MNFVKYVDYRYQELALEANQKPFSSIRGAHCNALTWILQTYAFITAIAFIPMVLIGYITVLLHIRRAPIPALDLLKADHDSGELARRKKMQKKLGMSGSQKIGLSK